MIRKKLIAYIIWFLMFATYSLNAQTFIKVDDNGWFFGTRHSAPTFTDLDFDGLYDMIVGNNDGTLSHFEQVSSGSTMFVGVNENFSLIDVGSYSAPVFTNIDNDGLKDLIIGNSTGSIDWYEQDSPGSSAFTNTNIGFGITVPSGASKPTFIDIDNDNLLDMIIGRSDGKLSRYEQAYTNSQVFNLIDDFFTGIDYGSLSAPVFRDIDNDNLLDLFVGNSASNSLYHYEQASVGSTSFNYINIMFVPNTSAYNIPVIEDIDNDGLLDLLQGTTDGNITHHQQQSANSYSFNTITGYFSGVDLSYFSAPSTTDFNSDGLIDIVFGAKYGLHHFEQMSLDSDIFEYVGLLGPSPGQSTKPTFTDLNDDGLLDLIIGSKWGSLAYYVQDSIGSTTFNNVTSSFNSIGVGMYSAPCFTDINDDGKLDLLVGEYQGTIHHYEQSPTDDLVFNLVTTNFCSANFGSYVTPTVTDIEGDGTIDLIVGCYEGTLSHYILYSDYSYDSITNEFMNINVANGYASPAFCDVDGTGTVDLILGESAGGRLLYKNYTESFWAGGTDGDWHTASNWVGGEVPNSTTEVEIPNGLSTYPSISSDANCESINLSSGATITVISGTLTISGDGN